MISKKQILSASLAALVLLNEYVRLPLLLKIFFANTSFQIRIVKDTVSEKGSKKPHKGYAFIVYEREKDMKGTTAHKLTLRSLRRKYQPSVRTIS